MLGLHCAHCGPSTFSCNERKIAAVIKAAKDGKEVSVSRELNRKQEDNRDWLVSSSVRALGSQAW